MRVSRWTVMGLMMMAIAPACTHTEEKTVASATPAVSPAAVPAPGASAGAEAQEGDEILMVWAEAEPDEGAPPLSVQLKADVSGGQGEHKLKWDFGDGSPPSSELNPIHKYEKAGTFRASVEVSDGTGDSDSDYVDIEVGSGGE
jgi:PKD repeat protein